jgi:hypothetical protein
MKLLTYGRVLMPRAEIESRHGCCTGGLSWTDFDFLWIAIGRSFHLFTVDKKISSWLYAIQEKMQR